MNETTDVQALRRTVTVGDEVRQRVEDVLPDDGYWMAVETITGWSSYAQTPLMSCPDIADRLGVAELQVKDESSRLKLKSFKSLGGAYAVHQAYWRWRAQHGPDRSISEFVVTCVTDGNHGLSIAWGAREVGCRCVIYVPNVVTDRREKEIRDLGAEVVRVRGNYDEVTSVNAEVAARNGWTVVTDTSSADAAHPTVIDVMQGYRVLGRELVQQYEGQEPPTHVFLQAGCGGMAGALVAHFVSTWNAERVPAVVIVEPENAACLLESARANEPRRIEGDLETIMAGLSVGEISLTAWQILQQTVSLYVAIPDDSVPTIMRWLAHPTVDRPAIVSGETGAAGLAGCSVVAGRTALREQVGLDETSRVLVINTEGDTDPELYAELVHRTDDRPSA